MDAAERLAPNARSHATCLRGETTVKIPLVFDTRRRLEHRPAKGSTRELVLRDLTTRSKRQSSSARGRATLPSSRRRAGDIYIYISRRLYNRTKFRSNVPFCGRERPGLAALCVCGALRLGPAPNAQRRDAAFRLGNSRIYLSSLESFHRDISIRSRSIVPTTSGQSSSPAHARYVPKALTETSLHPRSTFNGSLSPHSTQVSPEGTPLFRLVARPRLACHGKRMLVQILYRSGLSIDRSIDRR